MKKFDLSAVTLFDGAFGTELYNRGTFINRSFESENITNPDLVAQIHQDYLDAGAQVLTTNTWGANRYKLAGYNLLDKVEKINKEGARIALGVSDGQAYVAGSVGPLGVRLEPWGPTSFADAFDAFRQQIEALVEGGAHIISLETFNDINELEHAIKASKAVAPDTPVMAQIMITLRGKLPMGSPLDWAIKKIDSWGADVIGLNCSVGPQPMLSAIPTLRSVTNKPILIQPNAGLPKEVDGRKIYMCTPEYMAQYTKKFLQSGVRFVGGCCGTSPAHIKLMAQAFRHFCSMDAGTQTQIDVVHESLVTKVEEKPRVPQEEKSSWSAKICKGEMVYTIELLPPLGADPEKILERAAVIKSAGIDAINIPDGPRASSRMSAILTAVMIEQRVGIETVLHYTCRDRNLLGMQSDILGAHAIGLRNMLLVTGDPPKLGNYPSATGVFDVDSIGLTNMAYRLNGGLDIGKRPMSTPTAISIGVAVNPVHADFQYEMNRFKYKVEAGAEWAITQPVFDVDALFRFLDYIDENNIRIPIIAGIWPLTSLKNALFMNNEVPGVVIPTDVIDKMKVTMDAEESRKVGVDVARQMVERLEGAVAGIQMSAPFGRVDMALQVMGK